MLLLILLLSISFRLVCGGTRALLLVRVMLECITSPLKNCMQSEDPYSPSSVPSSRIEESTCLAY